MKITDVKVVNLFYEYPERNGFRYAGGVCSGRLTSLVRVRTDEGLEGIGSAYSNPDLVRCIVEGNLRDLILARLNLPVYRKQPLLDFEHHLVAVLQPVSLLDLHRVLQHFS